MYRTASGGLSDSSAASRGEASAAWGSLRVIAGILRSPVATRLTALAALLAVLGACTSPVPNATSKPAIEIQNASGRPLDIFALSSRGGPPVKEITLQDGQIYGSEPAGNECEATTYFVEAAGRRVATLDRMGCVGASLVVTPAMLTAPVVIISPEPS